MTRPMMPALLACLLASASLTLPALAQTQPAKPAAAASKPVLEKYDANTVLSTVNGKAITLGELVTARSSLPAQVQQMDAESLMEGLLEQSIDEILLHQAAQSAKLDQSEVFKRRLAAVQRAMLAELYIRNKVEAGLTPEVVKKRYEQEIAKMPKVEEVRARHILVETEAEAKEIVALLAKGGDFGKLAETRTKDPSGVANGGDLGYFRKEMMVPEFSEAAFKLKKGEVSAPVKTSFGWHVIKLEDRRDQPAPSFEQIGDQIRAAIGRELAGAEIKKLRDAAKIERAEKLPPADAIHKDELLKN